MHIKRDMNAESSQECLAGKLPQANVVGELTGGGMGAACGVPQVGAARLC